jgi:DNA-binding response OmpR family regulator
LPEYEDGRLVVRPADYIATADGVIVPLKPRELGLLAALASEGDRIVTREELLEKVWDTDEEIAPRAVDACVARLRAALTMALPDLRYIHTHARIGYRFGQERVVASVAEGSVTAGAGSIPASASPEASADAPAASAETGSASNL